MKFQFKRKSKALTLAAFSFLTISLFQNCADSNFEVLDSASLNGIQVAAITPPQLTSITSVPALSNSKSLTIQLKIVTDPRAQIQSITCQLNNLPKVDCLSLQATFRDLPDGDHTIKLNAMDSNQQVAQEQTLRFRVDATAPSITLSQTPPAQSGSTSATLVFMAVDTLSGVQKIECSADGNPYVICQSPLNLTGLSVGSHQYKIRAIDRAGNTSLESLVAWNIDLAMPVLMVNTSVTPFSNLKTGSFSFAGSARGAAITIFECALDQGNFSACTSPKAYSNLSEGLHKFSVRGRTSTGVLSAPSNINWTVDTIVPALPTLTSSIVAITNQASPSFTFSSLDSGSGVASYQCSFDNAAFTTCLSPTALQNILDGNHSFRIRALDNAGNLSALSTLSWTQDTVVPTLTFSETLVADDTANFSFAAADSASGLASIECKLDAAAFAGCSSPMAIRGLTVADHNFQVRATDKAGNQKIISHSWTVTPTSIDGAALYAANCMSCHSPLATSTKIGRSATQISDAIASVGSMNNIILTASQIQAVAFALKPMVVGTAPEDVARKYFPYPEVVMAPKRIFRLTRAQLDSTVKSLLPQFYSSSIAATMAADPLQTNYEYANIINFNSSNIPPLVNWIQQIADKVRLNPNGVINCVATDAACLRAKARLFILKGFRGDTTEANLTQMTDFYVNQVNSAGIADATADLVDIVLSSPQFLFRYEYLTNTASALVPSELLQMITYAIADAPPEKLNLVSTSAASHVQTAAARKATVDQILASADGRAKLLRFFISWLEVREPNDFTISTVDYPEFTPEVATAMVKETNQFLQHHLTKSAPKLKDITQSTQSFVSQSLASIYGMNPAGLTGTTLVNVNPNQRLGVFFQPAVIASHSGPTTTRLVKRGVFFARKVMCVDLGAPPPGTSLSVPVGQMLTERQKIETATNQPSCLGCHSTINPLGFFQENLSLVGRWRTLDNGITIDPTAVFNGLDEGPVNSSIPVETLKQFTNSMMFKQCFVRQLFRFYMGRNEENSDHPILKQMFLSFVQNDDQDIITLLQILSNSNRISQR